MQRRVLLPEYGWDKNDFIQMFVARRIKIRLGAEDQSRYTNNVSHTAEKAETQYSNTLDSRSQPETTP